MNGPRATVPMTRVRMTVIVDVPTQNLYLLGSDAAGAPNRAREIVREYTRQYVEAIQVLQNAEATVVDVH